MLNKAFILIASVDTTLRISKKKLNGTHLEIKQRDLYNEPELSLYADKPTMDAALIATDLGFFQSKFHDHIYILSRRGQSTVPTPSGS
jgi:hypothetical protein